MQTQVRGVNVQPDRVSTSGGDSANKARALNLQGSVRLA